MTAPREGFDDLPAHFRYERAVLGDAGVTNWEQLAALPVERLRELAQSGRASEARLLRLRAQARLMAAVGLAAEMAASKSSHAA